MTIGRFRLFFLENATMTQTEELWSPDRAASFLNLSVATLETWRAQGTGPRFIALSRKSIRYPASAILEFVQACEVIPQRRAQAGSRKSVKVVN
jgi:predicted DNA-binding transcriptional regulator AlpA